ncbi:MAG: hypothetical protein PHX57_11875, partial [Desulfobulbaceae bacterium]|nr:hypothetical protein [Desulfobulbaceae bacterium]
SRIQVNLWLRQLSRGNDLFAGMSDALKNPDYPHAQQMYFNARNNAVISNGCKHIQKSFPTIIKPADLIVN